MSLSLRGGKRYGGEALERMKSSSYLPISGRKRTMVWDQGDWEDVCQEKKFGMRQLLWRGKERSKRKHNRGGEIKRPKE